VGLNAEALAQERQPAGIHFGLEGTVIAGSYDPAQGTCSVVVGEEYADFDDPDQVPYYITGTLMTTMIGDQAAPQGGERALLIPTRGGYRILLEHGQDDIGTDAPGAPAGERWILHPKAGTLGYPNTPVFDAGVKLTNDGPTADDGLGGTVVGNEGALTQAQTQSGHYVSLDDTAKQVTVQTAGVGNPNPLTAIFDDPTQTITHSVSPAILSILDAIAQKITHQSSSSVYTIVDGAGNAISHVVPGLSGGVVALGDLASNLTAAGKGAINNDILSTFGSNVNQFGLSNLISYANLLHSVGAITAGQLSAMLTALILSWITNVTVPSGSAIVKIAA
jgi:hypothetical protein